MTGKIAIITGASRGLGRNMALHVAARGVAVLGTYRSGRDDGERLVREIEAAGGHAAILPLDLGRSEAMAAFASELPDVLDGAFGRRDFDFLVNNAGVAVSAPLAETTAAQFDEMVQVNLRAPFFLVQVLLPLMVDGGAILNISSGVTRFTFAGTSAYAAAKAGMEAVSRVLAKELGGRRIRVNAIAPGVIATGFGGGAAVNDPGVANALASGIALGRVGQPDDIGRAVAALLSDDFGWANGTRIEISGGQLI